MANTSKSVKQGRVGGSGNYFPPMISVGLTASAQVYGGAIAGVYPTSGYGIAGSSFDGYTKIIGVWSKDVTAASTDGYTVADIEIGTFEFTNDTGSACRIVDFGKLCYAVDDQTVSRSSSGLTKPPVGMIVGINPINLKVQVVVGASALPSNY
jgi:hypothetical protein